MLDFIRNYWKLIVLVFIVFLEVLILLLKKRPVKIVDAVTTTITDILPHYIQEAERVYPGEKEGEKKLIYVIELVDNYLVSKYGLTFEQVKGYNDLIKLRIEAMLETPQKKGD